MKTIKCGKEGFWVSSKKPLVGLASLLLAGGLYPGLATAQVGMLEEIVVTAQKREQSLQDVAGAITAFGRDALDLRDVTTIGDLANSVPGLSFSDNFGTNFLVIRGVGLQVANGNGEPGTATHVDGVFMPRPTMGGLKSPDLARIEVLKGPQGTLYGRNATGGIVNFIAAKPTEEFEAQVVVGGGSFDRRLVNGFVSGPLSDTVLGRVSAWYDEEDGYVDNILPEELNLSGPDELGAQQDIGIRAALRILPTDNLTIDLAAAYQEQEYEPFNQPFVSPNGNPPPTRIGAQGEPNEATSADPYPQGEKETTFVSATVDWAINDNVSLRSISGYVEHTKGPDFFIINGPTLALAGPAIGSDDQPWIADSHNYSQEFNLTGQSLDGRLDWVGGLYYYYEDLDQSIPAILGTSLSQVLSNQFRGFGIISEDQIILGAARSLEEETTSHAVFADVTYSITEDFRLNLGIRYTNDDKETSNVNGLLVVGPDGATVLDNCAVPEDDFSDDATLSKVRFEWDVNENMLAYAQYAEGFKSGGGNYITCGNSFGPEDITSYEGGLKMTLLDGAMTANLSAYRYEYEGLQYESSLGIGNFIENVEETEIQGAELEFAWQATDRLSFDAGLSWADSEFTDIEPARNGRFYDITINDSPFQERVGNPVPHTPEETASLGVNWVQLTDIGEFTLRAELYYSSEVQFRAFDDDDDASDSYTIGNIFAGYTTPSARYSVQVYAKNVTDEEYINNLSVYQNSVTGRYGRPREYGIKGIVRF